MRSVLQKMRLFHKQFLAETDCKQRLGEVKGISNAAMWGAKAVELVATKGLMNIERVQSVLLGFKSTTDKSPIIYITASSQSLCQTPLLIYPRSFRANSTESVQFRLGKVDLETRLVQLFQSRKIICYLILSLLLPPPLATEDRNLNINTSVGYAFPPNFNKNYKFTNLLFKWI